ncbi:MAG: hypothetical protein Q8T08_22240 [Ignavibacteria bacterium]|nr:hypothetical protein [Ignavibacteria bacterium]
MHLLVSVAPPLCVSKLTQRLKGAMSRKLLIKSAWFRKEF